MIKVVNGLSTDQFTWNGKTKTFVAEASDLVGFTLNRNRLILTNPKTNGRKEFFYARTEKDEGDTVAWHYESKDGLMVIILND